VPADKVPSLYYEDVGATIPKAKQDTSLMVTYALASERQVEIRDINYGGIPMPTLRKKCVGTTNLCTKLMDIGHSSEKEVAFLECHIHRFYCRICCLKDTVAAVQCGGGSGSSSGSDVSRTRWETPRGRYDEQCSKFSLSMKPKFNRPVGERNHF
jgi:hypothetical protein